MTIRPYLEGRKYAPEEISVIGAAFADACTVLNFGDDNPSRAMLAQIVICLFEDGITTVDQLSDAAIKEMRAPEALSRKPAFR